MILLWLRDWDALISDHAWSNDMFHSMCLSPISKSGPSEFLVHYALTPSSITLWYHVRTITMVMLMKEDELYVQCNGDIYLCFAICCGRLYSVAH